MISSRSEAVMPRECGKMILKGAMEIAVFIVDQ
jgi:hypothetical protein